MAVDTSLYSWSQLTATMGYLRDGVMGFYCTTTGKHHIFGGWDGGAVPTTSRTQYSSPTGVTWTLEADMTPTGRHVCAYTQVGTEVFMVNGDTYNLTYDGANSKHSYKFNGTTWTLLTSDNGLGGYSFGGLAYLDGSYYFIGGQLTVVPTTKRAEIWKSTDGCLSFSKIADSPFDEGVTGGNVCVFNNRIWKIGGTKYSDGVTAMGNINRTYPRKIYSSVDGITWSYHGKMPYTMAGRHFTQMVVFDGVLWMIGGYIGYRSVSNIQEVWASDDGIVWTKQATPAWAGRHGCTAWTGADGIYMGWGTIDGGGLKGDVWKMIKT